MLCSFELNSPNRDILDQGELRFKSTPSSQRIKKVLPKLIHSDQKGFINSRFIGENMRLTYDIINECNNQNQEGLISIIYFEKAFD